jgi:DNA-binding NarL/FixJ family response regulator
MREMITVLTADRSPLYRRGIEVVLNNTGLKFKALEAGSFEQVETLLSSHAGIGLLVIDANLPGLHSLSQLSHLVQGRGLPLLMTTQNGSADFVREAFLGGVSGMIHKCSALDKVKEALLAVLGGGYWHPEQDKQSWLINREQADFVTSMKQLSKKEMRVACLLKEGLMNKQIALQLKVSEHTVKAHVYSIYRKLNVNNRTKLATNIQQLEPAGMGWCCL